MERYGGGRFGPEDGAARLTSAHLSTRRRGRRAFGLDAVVREDGQYGFEGCGRRAPGRYPDRPEALREGVVQLVGEHPGLVRVAPVVVGPPDTRVLRGGA